SKASLITEPLRWNACSVHLISAEHGRQATRKMSIWAIIAIVAGTAVFMEFVAWATHKYVMHGALWYLHSDHHKKDHYDFLERNDAFFLIFAVPSMTLFIVGSL